MEQVEGEQHTDWELGGERAPYTCLFCVETWQNKDI